MGKKALAKAFASQLPHTLLDLQRLMGTFNFASQFVPDYNRLVAPIISVMSSTSEGKWS